MLFLAATTGYQTRSFEEAAERLGVDLVYATDRCNVLDDPWRDGALPVRFHREIESTEAIVAWAARNPVDGIVAVGDRPAPIAARAARALGLKWHEHAGTVAARHKLRTRERLRDGGLPVPWFRDMPIAADPHTIAGSIAYPAVVKAAALSGSRGVIRVDTAADLVAAVNRLRALMRAPDIRAERSDMHDRLVLEGYVDGREFALEGLMIDGAMKTLAIFDKPDPLEGPFFEETIYVTPSREGDAVQRAIRDTIARAAVALGLCHGPIHAECRVNDRGVFVLEVAARPIGGLCARSLRFRHRRDLQIAPASDARAEARAYERDQRNEAPPISLEELILRHALGEPLDAWERERDASGVMMIPIPRRGVLRSVLGIEGARAVAGIDDLRITAKLDQLLIPLPEGASYLGFIFAHAPAAAAVEHALRTAHARLDFVIDPEVRVLQSAHG
jgi:hypothetical protein